MKQPLYTVTPKRGNYLIGVVIFGAASIFGLLVAPGEIAPIVAGFFGIFFLVHLFLFLRPSITGTDVSSSIANAPDPISSTQRLTEINELHQKGLITDEEFSEKRRQIINDL